MKRTLGLTLLSLGTMASLAFAGCSTTSNGMGLIDPEESPTPVPTSTVSPSPSPTSTASPVADLDKELKNHITNPSSMCQFSYTNTATGESNTYYLYIDYFYHTDKDEETYLYSYTLDANNRIQDLTKHKLYDASKGSGTTIKLQSPSNMKIFSLDQDVHYDPIVLITNQAQNNNAQVLMCMLDLGGGKSAKLKFAEKIPTIILTNGKDANGDYTAKETNKPYGLAYSSLGYVFWSEMVATDARVFRSRLFERTSSGDNFWPDKYSSEKKIPPAEIFYSSLNYPNLSTNGNNRLAILQNGKDSENVIVTNVRNTDKEAYIEDEMTTPLTEADENYVSILKPKDGSNALKPWDAVWTSGVPIAKEEGYVMESGLLFSSGLDFSKVIQQGGSGEIGTGAFYYWGGWSSTNNDPNKSNENYYYKKVTNISSNVLTQPMDLTLVYDGINDKSHKFADVAFIQQHKGDKKSVLNLWRFDLNTGTSIVKNAELKARSGSTYRINIKKELLSPWFMLFAKDPIVSTVENTVDPYTEEDKAFTLQYTKGFDQGTEGGYIYLHQSEYPIKSIK